MYIIYLFLYLYKTVKNTKQSTYTIKLCMPLLIVR